MKVKEKIDVSLFAGTHREFADMTGLANALRKNNLVWSWGASAWTKANDYCLRFKVNGHHHKGHVYLAVNAMDLFDIYLTSNQGTIKKIFTDVYLEELVDTIDVAVEKIAAYSK
jgi:hypothetical protein